MQFFHFWQCFFCFFFFPQKFWEIFCFFFSMEKFTPHSLTRFQNRWKKKNRVGKKKNSIFTHWLDFCQKVVKIKLFRGKKKYGTFVSALVRLYCAETIPELIATDLLFYCSYLVGQNWRVVGHDFSLFVWTRWTCGMRLWPGDPEKHVQVESEILVRLSLKYGSA